ncbi:MAG: purine-nucleoside phosphorylase [Clostridiales bacterium]|nr:purine-nucleoside phosphorylase [Clostridiales bacterium]
MATAHNEARIEDIASTVIMPGDPLRSKFIAETFLQDYTLVNNVRGVQGYTGTYNGKRVTVMATGMGNPAMGIYSYELFKFYNVDKIIRVGSIGSMREDVKVKDVVIADRVYTNTNYNNFYINNGGEGYILGSSDLVDQAKDIAERLGMPYHVGSTLCSDTFYTDEDEVSKSRTNNLLGVEMEGAALYLNAERLGKQALVICTVSNNIITGEETSSAERQTAFTDMMKVALELA